MHIHNTYTLPWGTALSLAQECYDASEFVRKSLLSKLHFLQNYTPPAGHVDAGTELLDIETHLFFFFGPCVFHVEIPYPPLTQG